MDYELWMGEDGNWIVNMFKIFSVVFHFEHSPTHLFTNTNIHASTPSKWNDDHPKSNSNGKNYSIPKWQIELHISFSFFFFFFLGEKNFLFIANWAMWLMLFITTRFIDIWFITWKMESIFVSNLFVTVKSKINPFNFEYYSDFGFGYYLLLTLNQARHWDANMV